MRYYHTLLGTGLLLVAGCNTAPGDSYQVYLDPAFTTQQQQDIISACQQWEANVPVHLEISISECSGKHNGQICIHPSTSTAVIHLGATQYLSGLIDSKGDTSGLFGVDGGNITLYTTNIARDKAIFSQVAMHELGHAMGLVHHTGGLYLMNPQYGSPLSCNDVGQWYYVRGMRGFCSLTQ